MTKIMCTPYSDRDAWELGATFYKGTLFLEEHDLKGKDKFGSDDRSKLMTYWGYKFENLCTVSAPPTSISLGDPCLEQRKLDPVNTNIQFCSVFRTALGKHDLVLGAEVDCLTREVRQGEPPQNAYAELKTNRVIQDDRQQTSFEKFKLMKVWAQSYLAGIPKVIFGFRTDHGEISHLQHFETAEFPRLVRGKPGMWDPNRCLSFADQVLSFIRSHATVDDRETVYTVRYVPPSSSQSGRSGGRGGRGGRGGWSNGGDRNANGDPTASQGGVIEILAPTPGRSQAFIPSTWTPPPLAPQPPPST
ncbi:RAI1 like PD-XK nuclease-domain-containing protein [Entophlyctis helioformis]|nr:RAI1 like PD-XK nuclease-domain-containing protein [Entophlyctis helioformis]